MSLAHHTDQERLSRDLLSSEESFTLSGKHLVTTQESLRRAFERVFTERDGAEAVESTPRRSAAGRQES